MRQQGVTGSGAALAARAGVSVFAAAAILVSAKLALLQWQAPPSVGFTSWREPAAALVHAVALVPATLGAAVASLILAAWTLGTVLERAGASRIAVMSAAAVASLGGLFPLVRVDAVPATGPLALEGTARAAALVATPYPLMVGVTVAAALLIGLAHAIKPMDFSRAVLGAATGGVFLYLTANLLGESGVASAVPITWEFARNDPKVAVVFGGAMLAVYLAAFLLGAWSLIPSVRGPLGRWVMAPLAAAMGLWVVAVPAFLLDRVLIFGRLRDFRFGLELLAVALMAYAVGNLAARLTRASVAAVWVVMTMALATVLIMVPPAESLWAPRLTFDEVVKGLWRKALDADNDNVSPYLAGGDCDDARRAVRPAQGDIPRNGVDDNCLGGDLTHSPAPKPVWRRVASPPPPRKLILVTIDTLRGDMVFAKEPRMPKTLAFARRNAGFSRAYSAGGATAIGMLNLFYPERTLPRHGRRARSLFDYLDQAGYDTACFFPSYRPYSPMINQALLSRCGKLDVATGGEIQRIAYGEDVLRKAAAYLKSAPDNTFAWIMLDDVHDYYIHRPGAGYRFQYFFDVLPSVTIPSLLVESLRARYTERAGYLDSVLSRRLYAPLENDPALAGAVFVLTADHGEEFLEHGGFFHGVTLYEETIHVPLVFRDGLAGGVADHPVEIQDATRSFMQALGFERVGAPPHDLRQPESKGRILTFMLDFNGLLAVREGNYKLILDARNGASMLFDLEADPGETRDRSLALPEVNERLRALADLEITKLLTK